MKRAYLVLFINRETRVVERTQIASEFPVSTIDTNQAQVCAMQLASDSFDRAQRRMLHAVSGPAWAWVREI